MNREFKIGDLVIVDFFSSKEDKSFEKMMLGRYDGAVGVITRRDDTHIDWPNHALVMFPDGTSCRFGIEDLIHLESDEKRI